MSGLWDQFATLGGTVLFMFGLSKVPFVKKLWDRNVTAPFAAWIAKQLYPVHDRIDGLHNRISELADALDYEFKNNGGNSLRDRVDRIVEQTTPA